MTYYPMPLGQTRPAVLACPHCSYLHDGNCLICPPGDPHPACEGCVDGRLPPKPWWQRDIALAVGTATIVSIASAIIVSQVKKRTTLLK